PALAGGDLGGGGDELRVRTAGPADLPAAAHAEMSGRHPELRAGLVPEVHGPAAARLADVGVVDVDDLVRVLVHHLLELRVHGGGGARHSRVVVGGAAHLVDVGQGQLGPRVPVEGEAAGPETFDGV